MGDLLWKLSERSWLLTYLNIKDKYCLMEMLDDLFYAKYNKTVSTLSVWNIKVDFGTCRIFCLYRYSNVLILSF